MLRDMPYIRKNKDTDEMQVLNVNKTLSVPDEKLLKHLAAKEEAEAEAARDRTFEEFKETYLDHIEGKIAADTRTAGRKDSDDEGGPPVSRGGGRTGRSGQEGDGDDGKSGKKSASKRDYESVGSRKLDSAGGESRKGEMKENL